MSKEKEKSESYLLKILQRSENLILQFSNEKKNKTQCNKYTYLLNLFKRLRHSSK